MAIFTGTFVENKDGVARSLYELVRSLLADGHDVGIWTPEYTPFDPRVQFFKIPSIPLILYPDYRMTIYFKRVSKELERFRPDIIQISTPDLIALKFLGYAKKVGIPVVTMYHTDFPSYLKYYHLSVFERLVWWALIRNYNRCDAVFAPTYEMKEQLERKGVKHVMVWSRGIRREVFSPQQRSEEMRRSWGAENKVVVLFSGRFVKYKDLDVVKGVYETAMKERISDLKFVLIGSGPMEEELKRDMPEAEFLGYLSGNDLASAYASADIFIFPSTTETFGNVVLEAISSGLPVIVSDIGGCMEIVKDSRAGIICEAHNVESFYKALLYLVENDDLYCGLRERGQGWTEMRSWKNINGKLIDFYKTVVKQRIKRERP